MNFKAQFGSGMKKINTYNNAQMVKIDDDYRSNGTVNGVNTYSDEYLNSIPDYGKVTAELEKGLNDKANSYSNSNNENNDSTVFGTFADKVHSMVEDARELKSENGETIDYTNIDWENYYKDYYQNWYAEHRNEIIANGWTTSGVYGLNMDASTFKTAGATAANGTLSLLKGVASFGEAIVDAAGLVVGGAVSVITGLSDVTNGLVTGDWSWSSTKNLWNDAVVPFVSYNMTNAMDEAIGVRQKLDEWSLIKSDGAACQILEGVGYIGGIVALTIATAGAGSAVLTVGGTGGTGVVTAGAAAANVTGATLTVSSSALVSGGIAATAGFGKNTALAWNEGASVGEGLGYGAVKGAYEGLEMIAGYSINSLKVFKGVGVIPQIKNSLIHVGLDALDGGSGALIDPAISLIYAKGQTYGDIYRANGGFKNVLVQASSAAIMSAVSEIPDIRRAAVSDVTAKGGLIGGVASNQEYGVTPLGDAMKELETRENSLKGFIDADGKLTPEREAVHRQIIDDILRDKVPVDGQAEFRMMGGGPASGKSSVGGLIKTLDDKSTVVVDPDKIKEMLPGYSEMSKATSDAAAFYHEESSALAKRLSNVALSGNYNVVYDGTGDGSVSSVVKKIEAARSSGHRVTAVYVTIDTEEALIRNRQRYLDAISKGELPRLVPDQYVVDCHRKVTDICMECSDLFDFIELYDNNGPKGSTSLIAIGGGGKKLSALSGMEELFKNFLAKGTNG